MNSRRTGCASPAGNRSRMPPRSANSPCSSTGSSRLKPASTSSSARSVGAMSCPGFRSSDAARSRAGAVTLGSSAAADATMTRAVPLAAACSARARADATPKCGARPRYGSTSCEGNGRTACSAEESDSPSSALTKNRASPTACSRSASLGTTRRMTPCGSACAAAATNSARADGVSPDTARAGASMPLRAMAVFSRARRLSDVEVVTPAEDQCTRHNDQRTRHDDRRRTR